MELTGYDNRLRLVLACTGLALLLLVGRLWMPQLTAWGDHYTLRAATEHLHIVWKPAERGLLLDRDGDQLAGVRSEWDVEVEPAKFPDAKQDPAAKERIVRLLTEILKVPMPDLRKALAAALASPALAPGPLKGFGEDVPFEIVARIRALQLELPGITIATVGKRFYPQGRLAAHVLGYVGPISADRYQDLKDVTYAVTDPGQSPEPLIADQVYAPDSLVGRTGVEALLENTTDADGNRVPLLQGRRGYALYQQNRAGRLSDFPISERAPVPGATVTLTIDGKLQKTAEQALDQALQNRLGVGAAVVLDVHTGEVLALVSRPGFDPNWYANGLTPQQAKQLSDPRKPQLNEAIAGMYAPGSIFKVISSCAAFSTTSLTVNDSFTCTGGLSIGHPPTHFGCWKVHGVEDYFGALAESCDVYFYNLVLSKGLSSDALADYAHRFGLGSPTGLGLPGEMPGFIGNRGWKRDTLQEGWSTGDTLHMVIGQGFISVTPLQMAVVTAAIANGGYLVQPRLLRRITWPAWTGYPLQDLASPPGRKVDVSEDVLDKVRRGMRLAVDSPHGTAHVMQGLGVPVAGKTGSAEEDKRGNAPDAWFICYAPADAPRYAICVFVKQGGHGGTTAAPVARQILAAALGVKTTSATGPTASD